MAIAGAIGIEMPEDFPTAAHNAVCETLGPHQPRNPSVWREYAGGWNAVAIRFRTAADADNDFTSSICQSSAHPPPAERQAQEAALFSFFVSGYSASKAFRMRCSRSEPCCSLRNF